MAFDASNMTLSSHGEGGNPIAHLLLALFGRVRNPRVWEFSTTDSSNTVKGQDYFESFKSKLRLGDRIAVSIFDVSPPAQATTLVDSFTLVISALS